MWKRAALKIYLWLCGTRKSSEAPNPSRPLRGMNQPRVELLQFRETASADLGWIPSSIMMASGHQGYQFVHVGSLGWFKINQEQPWVDSTRDSHGPVSMWEAPGGSKYNCLPLPIILKLMGRTKNQWLIVNNRDYADDDGNHTYNTVGRSINDTLNHPNNTMFGTPMIWCNSHAWARDKWQTSKYQHNFRK